VRRSQNVSAPAAVIVIVLALVISFLVFNRPAPENAPLARPVPEPPPVEDQQLTDMFKGLSPLGIAAVTPPLQEDRMQGVRVAMVANDSPAHRAGLQAGDFIVTFDQKSLMSAEALSYLLGRVAPSRPTRWK